jgi:uncharacterized membrane protein YdjX (TVP38/TMEM64 family)
MAEDPQPAARTESHFPWGKVALGLILLACIVAGYVLFRDQLSLASLAAREEQLRAWHANNPALALGIAFVLYVVVTGLSLPGATAMSLLYGWLFGFGQGVILVSFSSTSGATLAFLLSRYLLGDWIQRRHGDRLGQFNANLEREGPWYLLTLRLIPAVPFFVINVVMGLTKMRPLTFWWVSQLGMLPATCIYVWAGSSVPTLAELAEQGPGSVLRPHFLAALTALGLFPLVLRAILHWARPKSSP